MSSTGSVATVKEYFVVTSTDADVLTDGSLKVRLLRPLQRVRSIRLLFAEIPKTVKVVDLNIDMMVQGNRLVTIQSARAFRTNENVDAQLQHFGRIHIEDTSSGTATSIDTIVYQASVSGTIPRFVFENVHESLMKFEFRPVLPVMNTIQLDVRQADVSTRSADSAYIPELVAVSFGQNYVESGLTLAQTSDLAILRSTLFQGSTTTIRKSTLDEYGTGLILPFLTEPDILILAGEGGSEAMGETAAEANADFVAIADAATSNFRALPEVSIPVQDVSDVTLGNGGVVTAPLVYTIKTIPTALKDVLLSTTGLQLGRLHVFPWMIRSESQAQTLPGENGKPAYPYAFQIADYLSEQATQDNADIAFQAATHGRVVLEPSSELLALLPTDPVTRRMALQVLLGRVFLRTNPQTRTIEGTGNASTFLRAATIQIYGAFTTYDLESKARERLIYNVHDVSGRVLDPSLPYFALQMDRDADTFVDPEFLSTSGTEVSALFLRGAYAVDSGQGYSFPWNPQSLLYGRFPYSMTFEVEVEV